MKNIIIDEAIIKKALREAINEIMDEDRTELPGGAVEVDNFENIREMLKFNNPGDTIYFVQLMKRDKDNPGQHSRSNAATYIKNYFFNYLITNKISFPQNITKMGSKTIIIFYFCFYCKFKAFG